MKKITAAASHNRHQPYPHRKLRHYDKALPDLTAPYTTESIETLDHYYKQQLNLCTGNESDTDFITLLIDDIARLAEINKKSRSLFVPRFYFEALCRAILRLPAKLNSQERPPHRTCRISRLIDANHIP